MHLPSVDQLRWTSPTRQRLWAVLAVATLVASTMLAYVASKPSPVLATTTADPTYTTIEASSNSPSVDDGVVITVTARDSGDVAVGVGGDVVVLTSTAGTFDGSNTTVVTATDVGDGTYTAHLNVTDLSTATVSGTINGDSIGPGSSVTPQFQPGAASTDTTLITASPASSDAGSYVSLAVQLKDQYGNDLNSSGGTIDLSTTGDAVISGLTDGTTGTWSAAITDETAELVTVSGTLDGNDIQDTEDVEFIPGPVSAADSTIEASPVSVTTDVATSDVTVTARDAYGNARKTGGDTVEVSTDLGTTGPVPATDNNDGTYSATVDSTATGTATITGTLNGQAIGDDASVDFTPGALASFEFSTIADTTAGSTFGFTITAYDAHHNVKTDYTGGATLSGLATSPGCSLCHPATAGTGPDYGSISWSAGVGTVTLVKAYNAEPTARVTVTDGLVTNQSNDFAVAYKDTLGDFSISTIGAQTANSPFGFTVTAYDPYGNLKLNQTSGALSGLVTSPGCPAPSCSPAIAGTAGTYGSISWSNAIGTVSNVKAFNAQSDAHVTMTSGSVSETSNDFAVAPVAASKLFFEYPSFLVDSQPFNGQPIDTKIGQKVYHVCSPAPVSSTDPCLATSDPVKVMAIDLYGNRASATSVTVKVNGAGSPTAAAVTSDGVASIPAPAAPATSGGFNLVAYATGAANGTSRTVQAVNDLEACVGTACDNKATNQQTNKQTTFGKILKTGQAFGGGNPVTLQTQFLPFDNGLCSDPTAKSVGQTTEVKVTGTGVSATSPNFTLVLIYPKDTIKAAGYTARSATAFNVCLGATWLGSGPATPWKARASLSKTNTLTNAVGDGNGVYWGYVPDCSQLTAAQRQTNPCLSLRSKQVADLKAALVPSVMSLADFNALGMKDADLGLVLSKPWPWDGKTGLK